MATFPHRGRARDDIRPGLRTIGYRRRAVIAFAVISQNLLIVGVFYDGPAITRRF
jgi:plasmid stabilization system protein ParE